MVFPTHYALSSGGGGVIAQGQLYENDSTWVILATLIAPFPFLTFGNKS